MKWSVRKMVTTAMLAAVAGVLMSLEFSVPLMPVFYKVDFSDVPAVIALFSMGPVSGLCVEIVKILIKLLTVGTNSNYVGEFSNLIGAFMFILPIWLVSRKMPSNKRGMTAAFQSTRWQRSSHLHFRLFRTCQHSLFWQRFRLIS